MVADNLKARRLGVAFAPSALPDPRVRVATVRSNGPVDGSYWATDKDMALRHILRAYMYLMTALA